MPGAPCSQCISPSRGNRRVPCSEKSAAVIGHGSGFERLRGKAGAAVIATLMTLRIGKEESLLLEHFGLVCSDSVLFTVERDDEVLEIAAQFEVEIPGMKSTQEELLAQRQDWYIDQENNLGLFNLKVCIDDELFREDVKEFFAAVRSSGMDHVIIDLRENIGGHSGVVEAFLKQLPIDSYLSFGSRTRYSRQAAERVGMRRTWGFSTFSPSMRQIKTVEHPFTGEVFLLTGNQTFSAGNWIAVIFHDNDLGTVIGEPTGNAPSSFGDMISFQLPNTRFVLGVS